MVIPNKAITSVTIDTSALSDILKSETITNQFVATILRRPMTLFVSQLVISEATSLKSHNNALRMTMRLQHLCQELGQRFCPAPDHLTLMKAELHDWIRGPPVHARGWASLANATSATILEVAQTRPESYKQIQEIKTRLFNIDRNIHQTIASPPTPHEAHQLISAATPPTNDDVIIKLAAEYSQGAFTPEKIASDPKRFKSTHLLSHLTRRLWIANSVNRQFTTPAQEATLGIWRTKRKGKGEGTWHDIAIAASAAYANTFITNDRNQRERCIFLRSRGLLTFNPVDLSEFLRETAT